MGRGRWQLVALFAFAAHLVAGQLDADAAAPVDSATDSAADAVLTDPSTACNGPADIVFMLDGSDSVGQANFNIMTSTLQRILSNMVISPDDVQVGIIQFAGKWTFNDLEAPSVGPDHEVAFSLSTFDKAAPMLSKIGSLQLMGGTASYIGDAIIQAALPMFETENGGRTSVPGAMTAEEGRVIKHLVIITDSSSGEEKGELEQAAALAKLQGVKIYTVGIGSTCIPDDPNQGPCFEPKQMEILASSSTKMKSVASFAELPTLEVELANIPCIATYSPTRTPTHAPTPKPTRGPTALPTSLPTHKPSRAPSAGPTSFPTDAPTFPPTPAPTECISRLDLVFVIDGTDSISASDFKKMKGALSEFVQQYERKIGLSDMRVGLIQFGGEVSVSDGYQPVITQKYVLEFDLDDYSSADGLLDAISSMKKLGGNITLAKEPINVAQQVLTNDTSSASGSRGGRPYVPKAMVLLTDGIFFDEDEAEAQAKVVKAHGTHIFVRRAVGGGQNPCKDPKTGEVTVDCALLRISSDQKSVDTLELDDYGETICVAPQKEPTCSKPLDVLFVLQTGGNGKGNGPHDVGGVTREASEQLYDDAKHIIASSVQQLLVSRPGVHVSVVQVASEPADPCPETENIAEPAGAGDDELSQFHASALGGDTAAMAEQAVDQTAHSHSRSRSRMRSRRRRLQTELSASDPEVEAAGVVLVTAQPTPIPAAEVPPTAAPTTVESILVTAEPTPVPAPVVAECDWTQCRQTYRLVTGWDGVRGGGGMGGGSFSQNDVLAQVLGMEEAGRDDEIGMMQQTEEREGHAQCKMSDAAAGQLYADFLAPKASGARGMTQRVVVLVTDGTDAEALVAPAKQAKEDGAVIMVVELIPSEQFDDGTFQAGGFVQLQAIATKSDDNRFQYRFASPIAKLFDVESIGEQLVGAFCDFAAASPQVAGASAPKAVPAGGSSLAIIIGSVLALLVLTAGVLVIIKYWPQPPVVEDVWVLDPTQVEPHVPMSISASGNINSI